LQVAKLGTICFIKSHFHKIILRTFFLLKQIDGKYVLIIKKLVLFLKKCFLLLFWMENILKKLYKKNLIYLFVNLMLKGLKSKIKR
jgi:hypothetical protein